ncbi:hypothetical protein BKA56DRAFT_705873 [Ilyonectria sp. MPI-CAGE-AT-0026]|nr:hypothetical protein BKA56DRAFT_705873 [Ilyonectria sp. MPI-CAGE-AT-0026]
MGFWRNLDRSIGQFLDFQPAAYRNEIEGLNENELRALHKRIKRKMVGATTQGGVGVFAAPATGGISLIGTGVAARRLDVNAQRCGVIKARLREKGWRGHSFEFKDLLCGAGPAGIAAVLAPGIDHLADQAGHHVVTMVSQHGAEHAELVAGSTNSITTEAVNNTVYGATQTASEGAAAAMGTALLHTSAESGVRGAGYFALDKLFGTRTPVKVLAHDALPVGPIQQYPPPKSTAEQSTQPTHTVNIRSILAFAAYLAPLALYITFRMTVFLYRLLFGILMMQSWKWRSFSCFFAVSILLLRVYEASYLWTLCIVFALFDVAVWRRAIFRCAKMVVYLILLSLAVVGGKKIYNTVLSSLD